MEALFSFEKAIRFVQNELGKATGLPWDLREGQRDALITIFEAFGSGQYDNVLIIAPTGSGKSGIAMGVAETVRRQGASSTLLTPTRLLQLQVVEDFKDNETLRAIQGRSNYKCSLYYDNEKPGKEPFDATTAPCQPFGTKFNPDKQLRKPGELRNDKPTLHPDQDSVVRSKAKKYLKNTTYGREEDRLEWLMEPAENGGGGKKTQASAEAALRNWESGYQSKFCASRCLCPYLYAREQAEAAPTAQLNLKGYYAWNTFAKEAPFFKPRMFTVFDECHTMEDYARDLYSFQSNERTLNKLYTEVLGPAAKGEWVKLIPSTAPSVLDMTLERLIKLTTQAIFADMDRLEMERNFEYYAEIASEDQQSIAAKLIRNFKVFKTALDPRSRWAKQVLPPDGKAIQHPTLYLEPADLPHSFTDIYGQYNVFMSATIADVEVFCEGARIDRKRTRVIQLRDTFPIEHRPIIPLPVASVTTENIKRDAEAVYRPLAEAIDSIAQAYPAHKTLLHTNSYAFGQEIKRRVALTTVGRLLCPLNGAENKEALEEYKSSPHPCILMTPSCKEGYDFKDDLCRVQVFLKCPFPSPYDPVVRLKSRAWYYAKVATAIRQAYGRGTRSETDFSVTFLLDARIIAFIEKHHKLFPSEFHQALGLGRNLDWTKLRITTQLSIDGEKVSH